jgi:hypothetical protein
MLLPIIKKDFASRKVHQEVATDAKYKYETQNFQKEKISKIKSLIKYILVNFEKIFSYKIANENSHKRNTKACASDFCRTAWSYHDGCC